LLRNPLSDPDYTVGQRVGILILHVLAGLYLAHILTASFLSLGPAAQLGVGASGLGFRSGSRTTAKPGVFAQHFVSVGSPVVTAIRAFHWPKDTTPKAYYA